MQWSHHFNFASNGPAELATTITIAAISHGSETLEMTSYPIRVPLLDNVHAGTDQELLATCC